MENNKLLYHVSLVNVILGNAKKLSDVIEEIDVTAGAPPYLCYKTYDAAIRHVKSQFAGMHADNAEFIEKLSLQNKIIERLTDDIAVYEKSKPNKDGKNLE